MNFDNRERDQKPTTRGEKIFTGVFIFIFLLLMTLEILNDYEPKKLSALLFCISWAPLSFQKPFCNQKGFYFK